MPRLCCAVANVRLGDGAVRRRYLRPRRRVGARRLAISYYSAFVRMLAALALYRMVNGQRLGRLLCAAPEKHEAFAEALGITISAPPASRCS